MCAQRPPTGARHCTPTLDSAGAVQALYVLYRVVYLWDTFSLWHMGGFALLLTVYAVVWFMLTKAAAPQCVRRPAPASPPSTAAQHSCTRFGAHREGRAARRGCRREAQHSVPRVCAAGTRLSRTAVHSSVAAATSTRRRTHCNTHCG